MLGRGQESFPARHQNSWWIKKRTERQIAFQQSITLRGLHLVKMGQNKEFLQKYAPKHVFVRTQLRINCFGPTIGMFPEKNVGITFKMSYGQGCWRQNCENMALKIRDFHPIPNPYSL